MRVLIIGAKGMLGQELEKVFGDHQVFGWDRGEIDITEFQSTKVQVQNLAPDLVINAAAYNDVDAAEAKSAVADSINGYSVGNLARVCRQMSVPLVHYSTDNVFDGENREGYDEKARPNPINAYGRSKFLGEEELQKNADQFYLIRLSRLFGFSGSGKKSFPEVMLSLAEQKDEIAVVDEELSCPTYAPDLARLTRKVVDDKMSFGIYHAAGSGACSWYEFAAEVFKVAGKNVKLKPITSADLPRPARRPAFSILINTKLPPQRDWREALKEYIKT